MVTSVFKKTTQRLRLYVLILKIKVPLLDLRNVLSLIVSPSDDRRAGLINIWLSLQKFNYCLKKVMRFVVSIKSGGGGLFLLFVFSQKDFPIGVMQRDTVGSARLVWSTRMGSLDFCRETVQV